jgi:hypothetical protein
MPAGLVRVQLVEYAREEKLQPRNEARRMKKAWQVTLLVAAGVFLGGLLLVVLSRGGAGTSLRGESLPQITEPPGESPREALLWGKPNRESYTFVESPRYVDAGQAGEFLEDDDLVYLLRGTDATRVIPNVILTSYHVVNDVIDGEPVAVTSCALAGSACSFSRRVGDRVLTLGLTGYLRSGNSVLFDRETKTDWLQLSGEALQGPYRGKARLAPRPLEPSTWKQVKGESRLKVLAPLQDMEAYRKFHQEMKRDTLGRRVVESQGKLDRRLLPYTEGLGIAVQGEARFYPEDPSDEPSVLNDKVGGWAVLVLRGGGLYPGRIFRRRQGDRVLDFEMPGFESQGGILRDKQTSSRWKGDGTCVSGPLSGTLLETPFYTHVYWFAWAALHPETSIR